MVGTVTDTRPIPLLDLRDQLTRIRPEIDEAVARVLSSTAFVNGEDVRLLEQEFAGFCGAAHACAVANGTDALHLALRAYGVGPGDEVVTVAFTFIATGEAILLAGARPVFVDVEPLTHTMDPSRLEAAITPRTKVILPVHLYGHPADMTAIGEIARRHGLPVLEDAAQAHGAGWRGTRAGALGHAACFSFYPTKNLGAAGDAGMVTSSDEGFAARVRQIANHGAGGHRYDNVVLGTNSRLDSLQAAILRVKLRHLERWNAERTERAAAYTEALDGVPGIVVPREREGARSAWHLYTVRAPERDALAEHLRSRGVGTAIHYPRPIHLQGSMAPLGGQAGDLPVSERLSREVLCLPLYPELPMDDVRRVADEVRAFADRSVRA
jgi:dTDP-4-amino-4,6-dideoxygalactose transaminase